jgi:hypothetical protein
MSASLSLSSAVDIAASLALNLNTEQMDMVERLLGLMKDIYPRQAQTQQYIATISSQQPTVTWPVITPGPCRIDGLFLFWDNNTVIANTSVTITGLFANPIRLFTEKTVNGGKLLEGLMIYPILPLQVDVNFAAAVNIFTLILNLELMERPR